MSEPLIKALTEEIKLLRKAMSTLADKILILSNKTGNKSTVEPKDVKSDDVAVQPKLSQKSREFFEKKLADKEKQESITNRIGYTSGKDECEKVHKWLMSEVKKDPLSRRTFVKEVLSKFDVGSLTEAHQRGKLNDIVIELKKEFGYDY